MLSRKLRIAAITLLLAGSGCAHNPVIAPPVPLPLPARPDLPTLPPGALDCVGQSDYEALVERDVKQTAHIKKLEAIILSTHSK